MATRSGLRRSRAVLWLIDHAGVPSAELQDALEHRSGPARPGRHRRHGERARGRASGDARAELGVAVYLHRLRRRHRGDGGGAWAGSTRWFSPAASARTPPASAPAPPRASGSSASRSTRPKQRREARRRDRLGGRARARLCDPGARGHRDRARRAPRARLKNANRQAAVGAGPGCGNTVAPFSNRGTAEFQLVPGSTRLNFLLDPDVTTGGPSDGWWRLRMAQPGTGRPEVPMPALVGSPATADARTRAG